MFKLSLSFSHTVCVRLHTSSVQLKRCLFNKLFDQLGTLIDDRWKITARKDKTRLAFEIIKSPSQKNIFFYNTARIKKL